MFLVGLGLGLHLRGHDNLLFLLRSRISTDGLVALLVHLLKIFSAQTFSDILSELLLVDFLIFVLEEFHVFRDVTTEDVVSQSVSVQLLGVLVVTRETGLRVGDVDTTISGTLEGSEDSGTSGGSAQTDIQESLEGARAIFNSLDFVVLTVDLFSTGVDFVQLKLVQNSASSKQTSGVGSSPVGQTDLDTIAGQLVGVSSRDNNITLELGIDELADDVSVGDADNESVLGGVVLVLGLVDQSLSGEVVGLALWKSKTKIGELKQISIGYQIQDKEDDSKQIR